MISLSSTGDGIIGSGIALAIIASIAVLLRLATKKATKTGLAADDCWIMFALVTFWVYVGVELWGIYAGAGGAHMDNFRSFNPSNPSGILLFFKSIRVDISLFAVTITGVKFSILSLYYRIFPLCWFRRAIVALAGICAFWLLALILCSVFACFEQSSSHCIDFSSFYLILSLVEMLIEIAILCLPVRIVAGLQMPLREKILLLITFMIGGFVCITGIVRLGLSYRTGAQFDIMKCMLWSNIQLGAAIFGACLVTYRPVLSKSTLLFTRLFRSSSSSSTPSTLPTFCKQPDQSSRDTYDNHSNSQVHFQTTSKTRISFQGQMKDQRKEKGVDADVTREPPTRTTEDWERDDWPVGEVRSKSPMDMV